MVAADVVMTAAEAANSPQEPLLVLEPLREYLDAAALGEGPIEDPTPIGDGHSNVTYVLRRGEQLLVLRRPPRGPLPPSAHDVLREARLLEALGPRGFRVPAVLAACEDADVIGAPFYVMPFLEGHVLADELPAAYGAQAPARIGEELVDCLLELHAVEFEAAGLAGLGRAEGYLERQLKRFGGLLETNATRPLPDAEWAREWLAENLPSSPPPTLVHGDYRLGNVMFAPAEPRLLAVLDWEMATIGDPLADLGYMTAMWAQAGDPVHPVADLSAVTREPGFATREQLERRYAEASGLSLQSLPWYEVLALWKAAIFLEGSYKRFREGTTADAYFGGLSEGVLRLGRLARERAESA